MKMKHVWLILLALTLSQLAYPFSPSSTQDYFNRWAKENEIVGAALSINNNQYFYGFSNKNKAEHVTEQTQFAIGSITKTFVSVLLLKLELYRGVS